LKRAKDLPLTALRRIKQEAGGDHIGLEVEAGLDAWSFSEHLEHAAPMVVASPTPAASARFIVGLPRAGTTWMCRSLNRHPDAAAFGETMFWGKAFVAPGANGRHDAVSLERAKQSLRSKPLESTLAIAGPGGLGVSREQLNVIMDRAFFELPSQPTPAEVFACAARAIAAAEGKTQWVEKTPHHLLYASRILEYFPDARFVVMMREPYSFLRSYKHQAGHDKSAASRKRFAERYHPVGGAFVWKNSWRAAQALLASAPDNALLVRLEEVESNPAEVMSRVLAFLDLRPVDTPLGISSRINSAFEQESGPPLTDADIAWMNLIAEQDIHSAGYTSTLEPRTAAPLSRSATALPLWALRTIWDLRQTTTGSIVHHALRWSHRRSLHS
jgi:hypothetical protein